MSKNPACETGDHQLRRAVLSSFVGAALEWYDFFLYGAVAGLVFAPLYFPNFDPVVGTILSYATFAVGYIGRASGAVIFGHFGDKLGRKKMLVLTLYVMGIGTFAIGCIPTYDQIGIFAPLLLIICRFAQGLGLGGEWGGAILMSVESAPAHKRAFYGTLPQVGLAVGLLMASGVIGLLSLGMSDADFMAYGWRIAFISSIVLLAVGSYIRNKVGETKDFTEAKSSREEIGIPLLAAFTNYPKMMLAAIGARCFEGFVFAIFSVYSLTFLTQHGMDRSWSLIVVAVASAVMGVCMPFWGILADRIGKARTFGQNSLLLAFLTFLAFYNLLQLRHVLRHGLHRPEPDVRCGLFRHVRRHVVHVRGMLPSGGALFRHGICLSDIRHPVRGLRSHDLYRPGGMEWRCPLVSLYLHLRRGHHQRYFLLVHEQPAKAWLQQGILAPRSSAAAGERNSAGTGTARFSRITSDYISPVGKF